MKGEVHIDEFAIGGIEEGKVERSDNSKKMEIVCALELTEMKKVKHLHNMKIDNYSAKKKNYSVYIYYQMPLQQLISGEYRPLMKKYNIM